MSDDDDGTLGAEFDIEIRPRYGSARPLWEAMRDAHAARQTIAIAVTCGDHQFHLAADIRGMTVHFVFHAVMELKATGMIEQQEPEPSRVEIRPGRDLTDLAPIIVEMRRLLGRFADGDPTPIMVAEIAQVATAYDQWVARIR